MLKPLSSMIGSLDDHATELSRQSLLQATALVGIQMIVACSKPQIDEAIESGDMSAVKLRVDDLLEKIAFRLKQSGAFQTSSEEAGQVVADAPKQE